MNKQNLTSSDPTSLMELLASEDGMIRQEARKSLVVLAKPAVPFLVQALQNSKVDQLRWEAAKALATIGDKGDAISIPTLVDALEDRDSGVTWLAAEALRKFKKAAWHPLLSKLIKDGLESISFRQGVHHVFSHQKEDGFNDLLATLTKALANDTVQEASIVAAHEILKRMSEQSAIGAESEPRLGSE
ncbi:MAG: HEAT repeat domain-containing protein [bacterium]